MTLYPDPILCGLFYLCGGWTVFSLLCIAQKRITDAQMQMRMEL